MTANRSNFPKTFDKCLVVMGDINSTFYDLSEQDKRWVLAGYLSEYDADDTINSLLPICDFLSDLLTQKITEDEFYKRLLRECENSLHEIYEDANDFHYAYEPRLSEEPYDQRCQEKYPIAINYSSNYD